MPLKMEPLGTPNLKKTRKQNTQQKHQKNNTQKIGFRMQNDLILEIPFRARRLLFRSRKHENPQNPQNWSRGPPKSTKNLHSDFQKSLRKHDFGAPKSRHFACKIVARGSVCSSSCRQLFTVKCVLKPLPKGFQSEEE